VIQLAHLMFAYLEVRVYFDWVPSLANCSDGVSRLGKDDPLARRLKWEYRAMAEPPWDQLVDAPLETLAALFLPKP